MVDNDNLMITERTSSQKPNSTTRPQKVYIAAHTGVGEVDYVRFPAPKNLLIPDLANPANTYVKVSLEAYKSDSTNYYLFASVKRNNESTWVVVGSPHADKFVTNNASASYTFNLNVDYLLEKANINNPVTESKFTVSVFFFLAPDYDLGNLADGVTVLPSKYGEKAAYYNFYFSAKLPTNRITLVDLKKGDGRLKALFEGGNTVTEMGSEEAYKTLVIKWPDENPHADETYQGAMGVPDVIVQQEVDIVKEGYLNITGLENRTEEGPNNYNLALALMNKYQFVSHLSNAEYESPEKIEVLLEKQACFIMTAGFGEEHFVTDYFRNFRDEFLLTNILGKKIVGLYYMYSPKYAKMIYQNEQARLIVRGISYGAYYLMNYFGQLFLVLGLGIIAVKKYQNIKTYVQRYQPFK
ncbi:MAG: hypothetical protein A2451_12225 [Bdellovibrionales bacterium RIFOXYC2_FULL_39_8]|nr:MAG: hypothetical protein A2451_12225 [Bdellovibrionales bacterium RIFOXYC2_FULL_39_8]